MFSASLVRDIQRDPVVARVRDVDLVLTVSSGRSGTKLLTKLCTDVCGVAAEHEPEPRANFAMRPALKRPDFALEWFRDEKLAVWAEHAGSTFVETSHLYCKGLVEPLLALDIRPRFIILNRPAVDVARSLFQMGVIPARTEPGDLVLLRPDDPGVLPCPGWEQLSDYALCVWYALEIERRSAAYAGTFQQLGIPHTRVAMADLVVRSSFLRVARFLGGAAHRRARLGKRAYETVTAVNQNSRTTAFSGHERELPSSDEMRSAEAAVAARVAPYFWSASVAASLDAAEPHLA